MESTYHLTETENIQAVSNIGLDWKSLKKKKSIFQRDGGMYLHCTVSFTLGRKYLSETELEIETNIFV